MNAGFTLIELVVVLIIISLLGAIALPAYQHHIIKAHRSDGQIALLDLATRMEQYYAENHSYAGATLLSLQISPKTPHGFYLLNITHAGVTDYSLQAQPIGVQTKDLQCASLTLNQLGQKGHTGSATHSECWG